MRRTEMADKGEKTVNIPFQTKRTKNKPANEHDSKGNSINNIATNDKL